MITASEFIKWALVFGITPGGGDGIVQAVAGVEGQTIVDDSNPAIPIVGFAENPFFIGVAQVARDDDDIAGFLFNNSPTQPSTPVDAIVMFSQFDAGLSRSIPFYKDELGDVYQLGAGVGGEGTVTLVDTTADLTVDGAPGGSFTVSGTLGLINVGTPNTYAYPQSITTDSKGRVTSVTAGSAPTLGTVTSVATSADITVNGAPSSSFSITGTLGLINVGTANTYAYPQSITTDSKGRVTSVTAGSAPTLGTVTNVATTADITVNGAPSSNFSTTGTLGLINVGSANTYAYPQSITTDSKGRVTSVTAGSAPGNGTVTSIATSANLTVNGTPGGTLTTTGTLDLSNVITADTYAYPIAIAIDAKGRVTAVTEGSAPGNGTVTLVDTTTDLTVDGTPGGAFSISGVLGLANVGTANTYAYPQSITTDSKGRVTSITAGSAPTGGTVTLINTANGITGGPIEDSGTIEIDPAYITYDPVKENVLVGGATLFFGVDNISMTAIGSGANVSGANSVSFGARAGGFSNGITEGVFIGADADATADDLFNCAAFGAGARVSKSNAFSYGDNNVQHGFGTRLPDARIHCFGDHLVQGATEGNTADFPPAGKYTSQTLARSVDASNLNILNVLIPNLGLAAAGSVITVKAKVIAVDVTGLGGAAFESSVDVFFDGMTYAPIAGIPTITPLTRGTLFAVTAGWIINSAAVTLIVNGSTGVSINWLTTYETMTVAAGLTP